MRWWMLLLLLSPFAATVANGQSALDTSRWMSVGQYEDRAVWFDGETVSAVKSGIIVAWIKTRFMAPRSFDGRLVAHVLAKHEFDCAGARIRMRDLVSYDSEGRVVHTVAAAPTDRWDSLIPGSYDEAEARAICKYADARGLAWGRTVGGGERP